MLELKLNSEKTNVLIEWGINLTSTYEVQEQTIIYDGTLKVFRITLFAKEVSSDTSWFHFNYSQNVINLEGNVQICLELVDKDNNNTIITHQSDGVHIERPIPKCN